MACVIGVDVGGTNTDAVILQGSKILSTCKQETTADCMQGVVNSINGCLENIPEDQVQVKQNLVRVCIGTTHFVNAVAERSADKLSPVAVIRLCGPASVAVPPFADFPSDLSAIIKGDVALLSGGLQYSGQQILPVVKDELELVAKRFLSCNPPLLNIVISSIFSPLDSNQEVQAADILKGISSRFSLTLSSQIGRLGLIERENAAILNESLKPFAKETIQAFKNALTDLQLTCPFHLTQNDGTLISIDEAVRFPILTFSSGPTNSMRGAMFLTGKKNAIVVDIGGTTTDVGVLVNGFPREASSQVKIGGVRTNFQMPDVPSICLGGGSIITSDATTDEILVGPESVGYKLTSKSLCFSGDICTATDIAIAAGIVKEGSIGNCPVSIDSSTTYKAMRKIRYLFELVIDMVKTDKNDVPVLLVGGGSILIDVTLPIKGVSSILIPENYAAANAIGAALGMVSGRSDRIETVSQIISTIEDKGDKSEDDLYAMARDIAIQKGIAIATSAARSKGLYPGSEVIHEKSAMEVSGALRVTVKVVGSLSNDDPVERAMVGTSGSHPLSATETIKIDRDNPFWPYSSEDDMKRDDSTGLSKPLVDQESGIWTLTASDVECISIGAGILGCGGGGDPNIGRVIALQQLQQGKKIQIVNPCKIKPESFGIVISVAFMGAPVVITEKLINGTESLSCIKTIQSILSSGICEKSCNYGRKETSNITLTTRELDNGNKVWIANLPETPIHDGDIPLHRKVTGLMCAEVGGVNSFEPLVTGAKANLPVLDADGMGRAFPEMQMFLPFINGLNAYPSCIADEKGEVIAVTHISDANDLETFFRTECIRMGMMCGIATCPVTLNQVLSSCVLFSYSQAWQLGRAVTSASINKLSVVQAIIKQQHGLLLISGKVLNVDRSTSGGFSGSKVIVQGTASYMGYDVQITAKNENYIAQVLNHDGSNGTILAVTPDLITIIDTDTGYPITTEDMRYGLRVSVLVLPANHQFLSPQALPIVGPSGFGFTDVKYQKPRTII